MSQEAAFLLDLEDTTKFCIGEINIYKGKGSYISSWWKVNILREMCTYFHLKLWNKNEDRKQYSGINQYTITTPTIRNSAMK